MTRMTRRGALRIFGLSAFSGLALAASTATAQEDPVRIGYAVARTGANATGAGITTIPPQFAERWDRSFWLLGGGHDYSNGLVEVLKSALDSGAINKQVAVVSVADGFGIDLINAEQPAFEEAGFDLVYDETYPLGTSDFAAILSEAQGSGADSFVAFSYPPGSFGMTKTAQSMGYNPAVFYVGVGGAFPVYPDIANGQAEGVMAIGGADADSPKIQDYFARHTEFVGQPPDNWASAIAYASLEMLEQAIERVGLDQDALAEEIATGTFDTIIGEVQLEDNQLRDLWWVGQWQDGAFRAVEPDDKDGAVAPLIPKPDW